MLTWRVWNGSLQGDCTAFAGWTDPLMILLALLITSFPTLVRLWHMRFWKQLQRLVYIAVLFLFQHLMHAPLALRWLNVAPL